MIWGQNARSIVFKLIFEHCFSKSTTLQSNNHCEFRWFEHHHCRSKWMSSTCKLKCHFQSCRDFNFRPIEPSMFFPYQTIWKNSVPKSWNSDGVRCKGRDRSAPFNKFTRQNFFPSGYVNYPSVYYFPQWILQLFPSGIPLILLANSTCHRFLIPKDLNLLRYFRGF